VEINKEERTLRKSLSTLIENTKFLPDGRYFGFGLRYMYPIILDPESYRLNEVINSSKGRDAVIKRVLALSAPMIIENSPLI